ncbi:MAG: hypothetical protein ACI9RI_001484, partial [Oceanospirillaceae bacterium]
GVRALALAPKLPKQHKYPLDMTELEWDGLGWLTRAKNHGL